MTGQMLMPRQARWATEVSRFKFQNHTMDLMKSIDHSDWYIVFTRLLFGLIITSWVYSSPSDVVRHLRGLPVIYLSGLLNQLDLLKHAWFTRCLIRFHSSCHHQGEIKRALSL